MFTQRLYLTCGTMQQMENAVILRSAHDGTTLEVSAISTGVPEYKVFLYGPNFRGTTPVYMPEPRYLARFFRDLASNCKGWAGKKEWASLEHELSLAATIDLTGHISLSVRLRTCASPFDWSLSAVLLIEAGQLEQIASSIEQFVHDGAPACDNSEPRVGE